MEEIRKKIEDSLNKMGAEDIDFPEFQDDKIIVVFNSKEITSFVADIPGWSYSGIILDRSSKHQYRIDFNKAG